MSRCGIKVNLHKAYLLLNVDRHSSIAEIKAAFRKAASLYHPDNQSGHANVEKFHMITGAYNLILQERQNGGQGWLARLFSRSKEGILRLVNGAARRGKPRAYSFSRRGYWSTLNTLIRKLDLADGEAERIKAARSIFRYYRSAFAQIAIPRLPAADGALLMELMGLLAATGGRRELEAIAVFLFHGDRETMLAAYTALEMAGPEGHSVASRALGVRDSIFLRLLDYIDPAAVVGISAPSSRMRRARAFSQRCGTPVSHVMERLGYTRGRVA